MKRLHSYLYGRKFILRTDHKPLLHIFGENADLPATAVSRLQRWSIILSAYEFSMEHTKGSCNLAADCLSRLPLERTASQYAAIVNAVCSNERELSELLPFTAVDVAAGSASDFVLSQIIEFVKFGWPSSIAASFQLYYRWRDELSVENGCLCPASPCCYSSSTSSAPVGRAPLLASRYHPYEGVRCFCCYARFTLADPMPRLCPDAVGSANVNGLPTRKLAVGVSLGGHREVIGQY